jgi:hypothetical protein
MRDSRRRQHAIDDPAPVAASDWDDWLRALGPVASFTQTAAWADVISEHYGAVPYHLDVTDQGHRRAALTVAYSVPKQPNNRRVLRSIVGAASQPRLEAHGGPLLCQHATRQDLVVLLSHLDQLATSLSVSAVSVSAPVLAGPAQQARLIAAFGEQGYRTEAWLTALVDLTLDEDALLAACHSSVRKQLRRAEREGLVVTECLTEADFTDRFLPAFNIGRIEAGLAPVHAEQEVGMVRGRGGDSYRFFLCESAQGAALATLGTYRFNGLVTEIMSARTASGSRPPLPAQDLLHWEVMRRHRAAGDQVFDLAGFSPEPLTRKEAGIRRFKEKWGGSTVIVPRFVRVTPPLRLVAATWLRDSGSRRREALRRAPS